MSDAFDNLMPLPCRLGPRGDAILKRIALAGEIAPVIDRDYVVKGWLDAGAVSVLYGAANVGKSFLAIDIAHAVASAEGRDGYLWAGARVRGGPVLYASLEGGALFNNRLVARKARFHILPAPLTLAGRNGEAAPLAEAALAMARVHGPYRLIVIDTLARAMGSADENVAPDIAGLVRAIDLLRDRTGAHVMLVHHAGKDAARGARGHSALRGAIDTELELTADDTGGRLARATKQRDMPGGAECAFELEQVVLGTDRDGDPVTSCIIRHRKGGAR